MIQSLFDRRITRPFLLAMALGLCALLSPTQAAKVKVWHHFAANHYDKAQFKGAVVSSEGVLRLSRQVRPLVGIDAAHVWAVVEDREGNLFAATGDEAKIFKVTPEGKTSVVYTGSEGISQVLSLAALPDGSVYAGTGPKGQVVRIDSRGEAKVIFESPESYIWSLVADRESKHLYAGTGPRGRIYRLTPEGKGSVFYSTRQEHILSLAMGTDGTLYAGTDKTGLVYRIDSRGKGFVLFSAPQAEIRTLLAVGDVIYAGTSVPARKRTGNASASAGEILPASFSRLSPAPAATVESEKKNVVSAPAESRDREPIRLAAAPPPTPPVAGENSIYRIAADGTVREIFRDKVLMLSLLQQNGRLLVGTGMEGQLFEIHEASRESSEVARLDHGQILALAKRRDGSIVLGTGDPGKLYVLQDRHAPRGTVISEVLDARIISKWGALRWKCDTPPGTSVTVALRSGNVAEPDETWSDWSAEQSEPQQAVIPVPTARFLQYRVTLATDSPMATPAFQGLTLRYMTTNQAPEVTALDVPDLDASNLENPKKLKFKWTATDSNEDELTYQLLVKKDGWKNWVQLEEDLEKKEYEWDTTTMPTGVYQLKVVASDHRDNSAEDALTGDRLSAPFVVSHTPPAVSLKLVQMEGDQAVLEASAAHPMARLMAASFSVNGKKWTNVFPTDGLFDSKSESFRFKTDSFKPGTYVVLLRVKDAAGNTGTGDVIFTVPARAGAQK